MDDTKLDKARKILESRHPDCDVSIWDMVVLRKMLDFGYEWDSQHQEWVHDGCLMITHAEIKQSTPPRFRLFDGQSPIGDPVIRLDLFQKLESIQQAEENLRIAKAALNQSIQTYIKAHLPNGVTIQAGYSVEYPDNDRFVDGAQVAVIGITFTGVQVEDSEGYGVTIPYEFTDFPDWLRRQFWDFVEKP